MLMGDMTILHFRLTRVLSLMLAGGLPLLPVARSLLAVHIRALAPPAEVLKFVTGAVAQCLWLRHEQCRHVDAAVGTSETRVAGESRDQPLVVSALRQRPQRARQSARRSWLGGCRCAGTVWARGRAPPISAPDVLPGHRTLRTVASG